jgi:hypothetical protein
MNPLDPQLKKEKTEAEKEIEKKSAETMAPLEHKIVFTSPPPEFTKLFFKAPPKAPTPPPPPKAAPHIKETQAVRSYAYDITSVVNEKNAPEDAFIPEEKAVPPSLKVEEKKKISAYDFKTVADEKPIPEVIVPVEPPPVPPPPPPIPPEPIIQTPNMRSFAYDIKSSVDEKNVSLATVVMAEQRKLQELHLTTEDIEETEKKHSTTKTILIIVGIIALLGGGGALALTYLQTRPPATNAVMFQGVSPFVRTEDGKAIFLPDGYRSTLIQIIQNVMESQTTTDILYGMTFGQEIDGINKRITTLEFIYILESLLPETLARSLDLNYSFGIHSGRETKPYLILKTDSFDNAYAGMLEWESTLGNDLGVLFFKTDDLPRATSTANVSGVSFVDKIYFNKDSRVILSKEGKPLMLWTIVNRTFIIIAANPETLEEVVSRMTTENIVR